MVGIKFTETRRSLFYLIQTQSLRNVVTVFNVFKDFLHRRMENK